jgi:hypothetical protein
MTVVAQRSTASLSMFSKPRIFFFLFWVWFRFFAVSVSLVERQREELDQVGIDGWIVKPIDFRRLACGTILRMCGVTDPRSAFARRLSRLGELGRSAGGWCALSSQHLWLAVDGAGLPFCDAAAEGGD